MCWRMVRSISMFSGGEGEGRGGKEEGRGRGRGEEESILGKQHSSHTFEYGRVCIRGTRSYTHTVCTDVHMHVCIMCVCTVHMYMYA